MGALIGIIGALFSGVVGWFVSFITRKIVVLGITISTFILLTAAFLVGIKYAIVTLLALAVIPVWLTAAIGMFMPYNFAVVLANILSAQSSRWAYDKAIEKIKIINTAT